MHEEVSKKQQYYAKDGVTKLVSFIQQSGGTTALAGYAPKDDGSNKSTSNPINAVTVEEQKLATQNLLQKSHKISEFRLDTNPPVKYDAYFHTTAEDFAVMLVKRTPQGFEIVDVDSNVNSVNNAVANTLRKRFDLSVDSIRPLLELVYTQCLPQSLEAETCRCFNSSSRQKKKEDDMPQTCFVQGSY